MLNKLDTVSQSSFDLTPVNSAPSGITTLNGKMWVVFDGGNLEKVHVYNQDGTPDVDLDFDLDRNNSSPLGIVFLDDKLWVVDTGDDSLCIQRRMIIQLHF